MNGGFGMNRDLTRVSPRECSICKRLFFTPQDLITHNNTVHSNHHHYSTFSSSSAAAAPATLSFYPPNFNRSPNPAFQARNRLDLNNYRSGHVDEQGRLFNGTPAITPAITPARNTNASFEQQEKPKLLNLFPEIPSEDLRTLPLLCQLEEWRVQDTGTEEDGAIDLTLRL